MGHGFSEAAKCNRRPPGIAIMQLEQSLNLAMYKLDFNESGLDKSEVH